MTTRPLPPSVRLTCQNCGSEMIRVVADGLLISDGGAIIKPGYEQCCANCGAVHGSGTILHIYFAERRR